MKQNCVPMKDFAQSVWDVLDPYPIRTPIRPSYIKYQQVPHSFRTENPQTVTP